MNKQHIERLLEWLCELHNVPTPTYIFYEAVLTDSVDRSTWRRYNRSASGFFTKDPLDRSVDLFPGTGLIFFATGPYGDLCVEIVIHEFLHYFDYLCGKEPSEEGMLEREKKLYYKWMNRLRSMID